MQNRDEAVTPNGRKSVITHSDHEAHLQRLTVFLQLKPHHLLGLKMSRTGRLFWGAGLCRVISVQRPRYEHSNQFRGFAVLSDRSGVKQWSHSGKLSLMLHPNPRRMFTEKSLLLLEQPKNGAPRDDRFPFLRNPEG